jgi:hypothetical protein
MYACAASPTNVVARYHGREIVLKDIKVNQSEIGFLAHCDIRTTIKRIEAQRLKNKLEDIVIQEALKRYDIGCPPESAIESAVSNKMEVLYGKRMFTSEDAERQNSTIAAMLKLIKTWQQDPVAGEQLYEQEFAHKMDRSYWAEIKQQYSTREALQTLRNRVPRVDAGIVNRRIRQVVIKNLKLEKLKERLMAEDIISQSRPFRVWLQDEIANAETAKEYKPLLSNGFKDDHKKKENKGSSKSDPAPTLPSAGWN